MKGIECILLIPKDGCQTKYLLGDGSYTHVRVTVRGAPITGKPTPGGVVNHLKRPTKLSNDVGIGQCRHIRMGPSMYGNIALVCLEGSIELPPIPNDIHSNVKVSCLDLILPKECVEVIGWLYKHVKINDQNSDKSAE
jgi:hypothetical protein